MKKTVKNFAAATALAAAVTAGVAVNQTEAQADSLTPLSASQAAPVQSVESTQATVNQASDAVVNTQATLTSAQSDYAQAASDYAT